VTFQLHLHRLDHEQQVPATNAPVAYRLCGDDQPGHRRGDLGTGGPLDVALAWCGLELPDGAANARPDHAVARRCCGLRAIDHPAVRFIDRGDVVARVCVRTASGETHGALAFSFAKSDRRRAAFADAPRARRRPRVVQPSRAGGNRRCGDGIGLIWRWR
jgi:hypothetical protein